EQAAGNPAQQAGAEHHDDREAVDQLEHQRAAPDDDGHAHEQAEDDQAELMTGIGALGRARDGDHVVQAHHEVGHDDGLDGRHQRAAAFDVAVSLVLGHEQLDADPHQQQTAHQLQERHAQQRHREEDQDHAQADGAGRAPQNALHATLGRQVAARQGNDDGVVAAQQDVDQDDLKDSRPAQGLEKFKHLDS